MPQWLVKLIVIPIYVVPALWAMLLAGTLALRVWRSDYVTLGWLNPFFVSEKYAADELSGKIRAQDAIYQDEMIVGRIQAEPKIDERTHSITFPLITKTDDLDPSRSFVFRRYEVQMTEPLPSIAGESFAGELGIREDGAVMLPGKTGRVLKAVNGRILGPR
jgi:hypothetical protein